MKEKSKIVVNRRSAVTGKFVKKSYLKTHKRITETERNKRGRWEYVFKDGVAWKSDRNNKRIC